jgi:hypothetical protein
MLEKGGMHWSLSALQRRLVPLRIAGVRLSTNTMVDGPSPKLDQHEPYHSRMHYTINDALLNMIDYVDGR